MAAAPVVSYNPAPHEAAYYDGLFSAADVARTGILGGAEAVAFLSRSKLPMDALKSIWTLADQGPTSNSLDKRKFCVAIRLIELAQNGQKAQGADLAAPPGVVLRPVVFEGISGVSVPMPGPPQATSAIEASPVPQPQQPQQQHVPPSPHRAATPVMQQQQAPSQQQQPLPPQMPQAPPSPSGYSVQSGISQMTPATAMTAPPPAQQPSQALTTQDPYTLFPQDMARYESLFPQYASPTDGYVHGSEAVALFSKSGLPTAQLGQIWNMVDSPVDNRLDKTEFAFAMHLIVCISKKNLPMPASLPVSLKLLKEQQQQGQAAQQPPAAQSAYQPPPSPAASTRSAAAAGRPPLPPGAPQGMAAAQQQQQPPPQQQQPGIVPPPEIQASTSTQSNLSGLQAPPPLPAGGMSITDAFEGLSTTDSGGGGAAAGSFGGESPSAPPAVEPQTGLPPLPQMTEQPPAASTPEVATPTPQFAGAVPEQPPTSSSSTIPEPDAAKVASPAAAVSTKALAQSYEMSNDDSVELDKLKTTLQKLQAENISLKAQLGSLSEEEKEVQKEIAATVHEIGDLSDTLTGLRAQVVSAKSALVEATAELKAAKEKKGTMEEMITETQTTKDALDAAHEAIEDASKVVAAAPTPLPAPQALAPAPVAPEMDFFAFDAAPTPIVDNSSTFAPPPPVMTEAPPPAPVMTEAPAAAMAAPAPPAVMTQVAPAAVETVMSDESVTSESIPAPTDTLPLSYGAAPTPGYGEAFGGDAMGSAPAPVPEPQTNGHHQAPPPAAYAAAAAPPPSVAPAPAAGPTSQDLEQLTARVREAQQTAADAETQRRQLAEQADMLKRAADEAEEAAKEQERKAHEKKKGFGRGKKKDLKVAEQLTQKAADKKRQYMEAQNAANNAQSVASDTKFEYEKLQSEFEKAEIAAASAASMNDVPNAAPPAAAPKAPEAYGGGGDYSSNPFGNGPVAAAPMGGYPGAPAPAPAPMGGYPGGPPPAASSGAAYDANVMGGGGGLGIPTPQADSAYDGFGFGAVMGGSAGDAGDPYANPF